MRIKIVTNNIQEDTKRLKTSSFEVVNTMETHLLIDTHEHAVLGKVSDTFEHVQPHEIIYVESFGNDVFCHTLKGRYKLSDRLYEFAEKYDDLGFLQINKSYVVNLKKITQLYPLFNMRYIVKVSNGDELIVTRTYVKTFKERIKLKEG